jgi:predicted ArsR family transcriptional regulator
MAPSPRKPDRDRHTRRALLDLLKQHGQMDTKTLAAEVGVTAMAVRLHLYELCEQKLIDVVDDPRPVGRPAKLWRLTPAADRFFPDGHAELAVSLIQVMGQTMGAKGMDRLLSARAEQQTREYLAAMPKRASLKRRVDALAKLRTDEGYMAEVIPQDDGSILLVENHCPICSAAATCQGLCAMELEVFQRVLGEKATVDRTEHIQAGARRCAYRIR